MILPRSATVLLGWDAEGGNLPALLHLGRAWGKKNYVTKAFVLFSRRRLPPSPSLHEIRAESAS